MLAPDQQPFNTPTRTASPGQRDPLPCPSAATSTLSDLISGNAAKRTRSQTADTSGDESDAGRPVKRTNNLKVEAPESKLIGKQSRDLLDNIGAVASERDELKHRTESLHLTIEALEKKIFSREKELDAMRLNTREMVRKAQGVMQV